MTFTVNVDRTGECELPDVFESDFCTLVACLDFARAHSGASRDDRAEGELRFAAVVARRLADTCEDFAAKAGAR